MSAPSAAPESGMGPFGWFGIALGVGAVWAIAMGLEYANTPTFTEAALPTIVGVGIAIIAYVILGLRAPANE